jgi:hypothetical protein
VRFSSRKPHTLINATDLDGKSGESGQQIVCNFLRSTVLSEESNLR